jgi:hypothetical protein
MLVKAARKRRQEVIMVKLDKKEKDIIEIPLCWNHYNSNYPVHTVIRKRKCAVKGCPLYTHFVFEVRI